MFKIQEDYGFYLLKILPILSCNVQFENVLLLSVSSKKKNKVLFFLKKHTNSQFSILTDIICTDLINKNARFNVIYNLLSIIYNTRIFVQIVTKEKEPIKTITKIYKNSNWFEREIWDMFGIFFTKHPDLRRILTDYGFEGFPLRKDFPMVGFIEVQYSEAKKNVVYNPLNISKKYNTFSFENSWLKHV